VLFASTAARDLPHPGLESDRTKQANREYTFLNNSEVAAAFYFRNLDKGSVDVEFVAESSEPLWLGAVEAYASPDAMLREFEHGVVLANPGLRPHTFDLARLLPGRAYRRISGTAMQDPQVNNGAPVGGIVELAGMDALFLVRRD
jgi:hypothetical protein